MFGREFEFESKVNRYVVDSSDLRSTILDLLRGKDQHTDLWKAIRKPV